MQCDQIGRNFAILATFYATNLHPKQAVSTRGLLLGFKSSLMWMFWAFKLSSEVDILAFWATFSPIFGEILFSFLVTLITWYPYQPTEGNTEKIIGNNYR